ncbi:hypothetical protein Lal_00031115 [Lupinus albus]|uniref:Putative ribosomal protein L34Ae n=1 Tax=Lupinus albus TaxID=3870 RepID=A0A6A4NTN5_LUPAL|nr:putative ribosomal protein L34Ae [Lupinus albus]KAF1863973.1 hypothetical protein Lal_00031115 [Lupinus albus]
MFDIWKFSVPRKNSSSPSKWVGEMVIIDGSKRLVNDFVYVNMLWVFDYLGVFIRNYVLYSLGLILRYLFRFLKVGDSEKELHKPQLQNHEIYGFKEELAKFLFWNGDDDVGEGIVHGNGEKLEEGEKRCFIYEEIHSGVHEDNEKTEILKKWSVSKENSHEDGVERIEEDEEIEESVFMECESGNPVVDEDGEKIGVETEGFVFIETNYDVHQDGREIDEEETESSAFIGNDSDAKNDSIISREQEEEEETDEPFFIENESTVYEDSKNIEEGEIENSVFIQSDFDVNEDNKKIEEEKENREIYMETETATITRMCQNISEKDVISEFIEEPTAMSFSFREYFMSPNVSPISNNSCVSNVIIENKVSSELDKEKDPVEGKEKLVRFDFNAFGGTDSSDEDNFPFNENSVEYDSDSESSTSSGLIWGNSNKIEDSLAYQFLVSNEGFESELFKLMMKEEKDEVVEENQFSHGGKSSAQDAYIEMETGVKDLKSLNAYSFGYKDKKEGSYHEEKACNNEKSEETRWEEGLCESGSDEENDFEWEHDDLVEQLKMELKNARQGGLDTIIEEEAEGESEGEEEEEGDIEAGSSKLVEDLKPLKIEEKLQYKDQIDEIGNVYKSYAEKMRKLDNLNYKTMHALGLLQLKDPLKLISIPKSTIHVAKPVITQNLWPHKASKNASDPLLKIVQELQRDLELVYVGQVCLSWEILCWQQNKVHELQQYVTQGCRYNHVAGELQLFQVLMNRFIENEPFQQGTRILNYVKNRCVIRNLLQVPDIKDDITKGDEEDGAIGSGRLEDIMKESMSVFREFVKADKDYGNVIPKVSQKIGTDPAISGLLVDIRTQLHKKERKLKDIVRSGNCIVRKFQKHHEDQLDHEQMIAQVGLKLISRVLKMSKLRKEQVIWCHEKLHRIKFLTRKIVQVEPSFLLFPC